jgi:DNA repair exonuclease SbcCD ATPase subunit
MILFKKIKFKNFGSFGNNWTEIDLNKNSTTLVCGTNGSGKSFALLDTITFALFGKPFRKINLAQLNNSINKKNCTVELEFSIDKDDYKIIRGLSPKIFEIHRNNKLINQDSKNIDYQDVLEEQILKMNYKTFTQVVILGSSAFIPFMQLTASDRRAVIENILDINIFTTMNVILKTKVTIAKENITDIVNKIELQKQKVEYQQKIVDNLTLRLNNDVKKIQEEIDHHTIEENNYLQEIEKLQQEKNSIELNSKIQDILNLFKQNETTISQFTFKISDLEKEIKFYEKTENCPKCKTHLSESLKKENIDSLTDNITSLETKINSLAELNTDNQKIISTEQKNKTRIANIEGNIKDINSSIREVKSLIAYKNKQLQESTKIEIDLSREKAVLKMEKSELLKLSKESEVLKEDLSYLKLAGDILKDNGVKIKIIKHYLPSMNKFINKYLRSMDFFIQFNIDEEFNEVIKSRHRDEFSYMNFSEGEKMRIDLALLLAWREIAKMKNSVNCNLLILDEIFDSSLDSVGTDEVLRLLNALGVKTNVFVISHKADQIVDKFTNTITFEKKNNFSKMTIS